MNVKTFETKLTDLLRKVSLGIKEVEFSIGFKRLKQTENKHNSYFGWFFQSEAEANLEDAMIRLHVTYLNLFILLSESKIRKQKSGISEILRKYSPQIDELWPKANRLLRMFIR